MSRSALAGKSGSKRTGNEKWRESYGLGISQAHMPKPHTASQALNNGIVRVARSLNWPTFATIIIFWSTQSVRNSSAGNVWSALQLHQILLAQPLIYLYYCIRRTSSEWHLLPCRHRCLWMPPSNSASLPSPTLSRTPRSRPSTDTLKTSTMDVASHSGLLDFAAALATASWSSRNTFSCELLDRDGRSCPAWSARFLPSLSNQAMIKLLSFRIYGCVWMRRKPTDNILKRYLPALRRIDADTNDEEGTQ